MVQLVEGMDPGESFSTYGNSKGKNGFQGSHNLRQTMFQNMVCLKSDKIWVF